MVGDLRDIEHRFPVRWDRGSLMLASLPSTCHAFLDELTADGWSA
ncbi:hypothetical protein [Nguyenibacter sp. L1]|nr:hypothetical protein [Nguyenibacter sp. L1]WRH89164.1 hypothetical protein QN315_05930 [Nguyenibacter sp. L1]